MTDTYRMSVELPNGAKFRAQGEASEVRVDLERFYALLANAPTPTKPTVNGIGTTEVPTTNDTPIDTGGDLFTAFTPPVVSGLDSQTLDRLFSKDKYGTVSLRALPRGESADADALLALIYGADKLAGEPQVTGSRLMKAATQSGLSKVDRIDRSLNPHIGPFVTTAGFKKGRRYGLTNPGIRRAEEILTAILG